MPRTGKPLGRPKKFDRRTMLALTSALGDRIEAYRSAHDLPSEAEAIRRLLDEALTINELRAEAARPKRKRK